MGPAGRHQERRVIRHAADQALTAPIFTPPGGDVAVIRDAETHLHRPTDSDDERWDDPDEGWFGGGHFDEPDGGSPDVPVQPTAYPSTVHPSTVVFERPRREPPPLRDSRAPTISVRPVACARTPWYCTKQLMIVSAGATMAAVAAVAVWGIVHLLRSPGAAEESSTVPSTFTSAGPAPTSAGPLPSSVQPPIPLPPPAPTASEMTPPPATGRNSWPRSAPSQTAKPEIGVTRTPVTRAPISVRPTAHQAPGSDSSMPGDAPKRRGRWPF